jgi:hypothetical protein
MSWFVVTDWQGRIRKVGLCADDDIPLQAGPGMGAMATSSRANPRTEYANLQDATIVPRLPLGATWSKTTVTADGVDEAVLQPLPDPCTVYIDGVAEVVVGGALELSLEAPGVYRVSIDEVQHLPQEWEIIGE